MKIRFLEDTYIRKSPRTTEFAPVGTVFAGAEIEVESEATAGEAVQQNNRWYHDKNGWFYWSGKTEPLTEPLPVPPGNTITGMMVMPAETDPFQNPAPAFPVFSPWGAANIQGSNEPIPQGETRMVPSLQALLAAEATSRPARELELTGPGAETSDQPELPSIEMPPAEKPDVEVPAYWQSAKPGQLNWGLQQYRIARDWWQQRGLTGKGVSIAILSTGVEPGHPDLGNLAEYHQVQSPGLPISDHHGLGTQAAVVAAGTGPTVIGMAPEARLLVCKMGEQDHLLTAEALITGLQWALSAGAEVVAMLVDFPEMEVSAQTRLQGLIDQAVAQGVLLIAPVGTLENKKPESRYPARMEGVLSVGAHDVYGQHCNFSARSYDLDLLAPGEGLLSSSPQQASGWNLRSASIAAAFVAGFSALVVQWYRQRQQAFNPERVFNLLRETAVSRRSFNKGQDMEYGFGILNPAEVLKKLDPAYTGPDPA